MHAFEEFVLTRYSLLQTAKKRILVLLTNIPIIYEEFRSPNPARSFQLSRKNLLGILSSFSQQEQLNFIFFEWNDEKEKEIDIFNGIKDHIRFFLRTQRYSENIALNELS